MSADPNTFFTPVYPKSYHRRWMIPTGSIVIYSLTVGLTIWAKHTACVPFQTAMVVVAGLWAVVFPAAFSLEYWFIIKDTDVRPSVEAFKYSQELARNMWIAAVAFLIFLNTGHLPGVN